jgi:mannose-6-phosphate isomerase-like protein (cupin superfamily)
VTAHLTSLVVVSVSLALSSASPVPQTTGGSPPATQGTAAPRPGSLALTAVAEKGDVVSGAAVAVHGAVDRAGTTGVDGAITLTNLPAGTYRARITREGFITLEKEVAIRAGARTTSEAVLTAAPPPPPPPPPPTPAEPKPTPAPANSALKAGTPQVQSLSDLAEQMLKDPQATERVIGCSGATTTRLILVREPLSLHRHVDVDETIYVLAGEGSLTIGTRDQTVGPGWVGLVPRGTAHSVTKRGRNPAVVMLSVQSGEPCK